MIDDPASDDEFMFASDFYARASLAVSAPAFGHRVRRPSVRPSTRRGDAPRPLLVMLHGAGGRAISALSIVRADAQRRGVIVVAPKSSSARWDVLLGGFGPDVATIDQALENAFPYHAVDPKHIAIGGFSDGASYALTLGLINGDLFTKRGSRSEAI